MKKNYCPHKKDILDYTLGILGDTAKQEFEAHLKKCKLCQKELKIESVIAKELSESLEPGEIEDGVLARVRLLKDAKPSLSWLYLFRMAIYAGAATITLLAFSSRFAIFFSKLNLGININILQELNQILASLSSSYVVAIIFGVFLVLLSSVFSYTLLRRG